MGDDWILSFECLGCGHTGWEPRSTYEGWADFWSEEMNGGRLTGKGEYSCDKCKGEKFKQWMTPDGSLHVYDHEVLDSRHERLMKKDEIRRQEDIAVFIRSMRVNVPDGSLFVWDHEVIGRRLKSNPHTVMLSKDWKLGERLTQCGGCGHVGIGEHDEDNDRHVCTECDEEVFSHTAYVPDGVLLVGDNEVLSRG